jgi:GWxTD domain-containing protein
MKEMGKLRALSSLLAPIPVIAALVLWPSGAGAQDRKALRHEEERDYYQQWLREDVVYIISDEEREIFRSLTSEEEKERFVEQFWLRRDPDPSTTDNEFHIEHYRRIQYANDWYGSGEAGWKTDRGRVYIVFGPPTEVTRFQGGQYERPMSEGGGVTTTYPFEKWYYRNIPGVGDNVELEFVDSTLAGSYRLALSPHEKDALLNVPNVGLTLAESLGLAPKSDRIRDLYAGNPQPGPFTSPGVRDGIFERVNRYFSMHRPPPIEFKDLKEVVATRISYDALSFEIRPDWIFAGGEDALALVTVRIDNHQLTYSRADDWYRARVQLYGTVSNLQRRIVQEFEDTLVSEYPAGEFRHRLWQNSVYQKQFLLKPGLYRLDMVIRDVESGAVGTLSARMDVPPVGGENLLMSSVILSRNVSELAGSGDDFGRFNLGDLKVIPEVGNRFYPSEPVFLYFQSYGAVFDQAGGFPSLELACRVRDPNGAILFNHTDDRGEWVRYVSPLRVVFLGGLSLDRLETGDYSIELEVTDRIAGRTASQTVPFAVIARPTPAE